MLQINNVALLKLLEEVQDATMETEARVDKIEGNSQKLLQLVIQLLAKLGEETSLALTVQTLIDDSRREAEKARRDVSDAEARISTLEADKKHLTLELETSTAKVNEMMSNTIMLEAARDKAAAGAKEAKNAAAERELLLETLKADNLRLTAESKAAKRKFASVEAQLKQAVNQRMDVAAQLRESEASERLDELRLMRLRDEMGHRDDTRLYELLADTTPEQIDDQYIQYLESDVKTFSAQVTEGKARASEMEARVAGLQMEKARLESAVEVAKKNLEIEQSRTRRLRAEDRFLTLRMNYAGLSKEESVDIHGALFEDESKN